MPPSSANPIESLIAQHFAHRYECWNPDAYLDTLTPDAYVVCSGRVARVSESTSETLRSEWSKLPSSQDPNFLSPSLENWFPDDDNRGVAWVRVNEKSTQKSHRLALGLIRVNTTWRVHWATAQCLETPDWAKQELAALADMVSLHALKYPGAHYVSLLELGYGRMYHLPTQRLLALPESRFSCAGTGACCSHELTIGLDDASQTFVQAIDWARLDQRLAGKEWVETLPAIAQKLAGFRHRLKRDPQGRCHFLTSDNRCLIHALAGRAVFKPCHVFPYRFAWTPDGICVTTHAMCPTARRCQGLPLAAQEKDLRERLAVADVLHADRYYLGVGQEIDWMTFKTIEGQLLDILGGPETMRRKLWVAMRWLNRRLSDPDAMIGAHWYEEAIQRHPWWVRLAFSRFGRMFDPCFNDLAGYSQGTQRLADFESELTDVWRALLFSKATTYPYGLIAGLNYLILTYQVLERQVARHAKRGISEAFWREFYAVVTSGTYPRILTTCHRNPATQLARFASDPTWGLTLLRL